MSSLISVVTPTYNEKDNITHFVVSTAKTLNDLKRPFEIVVVDDSSPDGTADVVKMLQNKYPTLTLITRRGKLGIGSAYFDGFKNASGDYMIGLDADLSPSLDCLAQFIEKLETGAGMVVGSRYLPKSKIRNMGWYKSNGSRFFNLFARFALGIPLSDLTHSNRGFSRACFQAISPHIQTKDHPSFFLECSYWAHQLNFKLAEVPITFTERTIGRSKLDTSKGLRNGLKTIVRLRQTQ